jgi:hypothetical protein
MDEPGNHNAPRGNNHRGAADRLREMLAQGNVADQRSNASVIEDIRQRVDGIAVAIASLADKVGALDTRLERLDERHDDQYDRLTSLEETLLVLAEALLCPPTLCPPAPPGDTASEPKGGHRREPEGPVWTEALPASPQAGLDVGPEAGGQHLGEPPGTAWTDGRREGGRGNGAFI